MSKVDLHFNKPGLQTLVQDLGRFGYQSSGVPISGPLDKKSAEIANKLVNNPKNTPLLEVALIGPEIVFHGNCTIAITGANLSANVNNKPVPMYQTIDISYEDTLSFGKPQHGCRVYVAIAGTWKVKKWLNSACAATHHAEVLTPDSVMKKNSTLTIETRKATPRKHPADDRPVYSNIVSIHATPGPEFKMFTKKAIANFFSHGHKLTIDSNRMGCRLNSRIDDFSPKEELISSGIVAGTIQVTSEGQPIVLLADAQTTGGYYRIANIVSEDLDLLGQLKPGDEVWFTLVKTR